MTSADLISLLQILILAAGIIVVMLLIAFTRNHRLVFFITILTLAASLLSIFVFAQEKPHLIGDLVMLDSFGLYFQKVLLIAAIIVALISYPGIENYLLTKRKEEYYALFVLATLGATMMVISIHFISLFVSLEILTISLYTLIGYYRGRLMAIEASLKYLVLAAMSSSFLLFGMALIYSLSGEMTFEAIASLTANENPGTLIVLTAGIGMMMVGIGFKLALAPFHMWTPDVYEGASSPVAAFIATVSKGAIVAVLLRFFLLADLYRFENIMTAVMIISILSMMLGNLLALRQTNIKRILAYSSISHFGYLLVAVVSGKGPGVQSAIFYITIYIATLLTAFGLISIISKGDVEALNINEYRGLFWKNPFVAFILTIALFSLAGIPLTAGFMGKFFILNAGVADSKWFLIFTLVASSVIGLYYYLRVVVTMLSTSQEDTPAPVGGFRNPVSAYVIFGLLGVAIIVAGIWPAWLMTYITSILR